MPPWKQAIVGVLVLGVICAALAWRARPEGRGALSRDADVYEIARTEAERVRALAEEAPPRRRGGGRSP